MINLSSKAKESQISKDMERTEIHEKYFTIKVRYSRGVFMCYFDSVKNCRTELF